MAKVTIQRNTISGEMVSVEVEVKGPEQWVSLVKPFFDYVDARMIKLNDRVLKANQEIGNLDEETYGILRSILAGTQGYVLPDRQMVAEKSADDKGLN